MDVKDLWKNKIFSPLFTFLLLKKKKTCINVKINDLCEMHLAARWSSRVSQHLAQVVVTNLGAASVPFVTSLPAPGILAFVGEFVEMIETHRLKTLVS